MGSDFDDAVELNARQQANWERFVINHRRRHSSYAVVENRVGIANGFIAALVDEPNDWAFIVKLAVLCEAALTHTVVESLDDHENRDVWFEHFSKMSNSLRLELAFKLNLIPKSAKGQLDALAQIRNSFAHDVGNVQGSLSAYFEACTLDKKVELATKLLCIKHKSDHDWRFCIEHTRLVILAGVLEALCSLAQGDASAPEAASLNALFMMYEMHNELLRHPNGDG